MSSDRTVDDPYRTVAVVFAREARDIQRLDVALGPCIPLPNRKRPLVGATAQEPGDHRIYEALHPLLATSVDGPWQATRLDPPGRLATFSESYISALSALNHETRGRRTERPTDYEWRFKPYVEVAERWYPLVDWRRPVSLRWVSQHLLWLCATARESVDHGRPLYCWSGPGFAPYGLVAGPAHALPAYLAAKRGGAT